MPKQALNGNGNGKGNANGNGKGNGNGNGNGSAAKQSTSLKAGNGGCAVSSKHTEETEEPAFTEEGLQELWNEKYEFRVTQLGMSKQKAREWTNRTIKGIKEQIESAQRS
jgi:hypothetical protein